MQNQGATASLLVDAREAARLLASNTSKMNRNLVRFERQAKSSFARAAKSMLSRRHYTTLATQRRSCFLPTASWYSHADLLSSRAEPKSCLSDVGSRTFASTER